ncbi:FAM186A [Symbiodinium sp. CCMP2592]|nr:FAM186A [Symbiodinium sp. CCMP2592]
MADNSFAWAATKGLLRTNEVHKTEEAKLVVEEKFSNKSERGSLKELTASGTDEDAYMLENDVPTTETEAISHKPADGTMSKSKCVFPTVQKNDSPLTVLPTFLSVLGKKIENGCLEQEKMKKMGNPRADEIANHLQSLLDSLNTDYKKLTDKEAEAITDTDGKSVKLKEEIMALFVQCTKTDVILNNYIARGKSFKPSSSNLGRSGSKDEKNKKSKKKPKKDNKSASKKDKASPKHGDETEEAKPASRKSKKSKDDSAEKPNKKKKCGLGLQSGEDSPSGGSASGSEDDLADALMMDMADAKSVVRLATIASRRMKKLGVVDPDMERIAGLGHGSYHNASRALHRFVHREGKTLPIPISTTPLTIRQKRGGSIDVKYPILRLTDWLNHILGEAGGQFVLAGHHVWDTGHQDVFRRFWQRYESADSQHVIYSQKSEQERSRTIPFCIHGDEGRGLAKVPVLITNFQCVVPYMGEDRLNTHGPPA